MHRHPSHAPVHNLGNVRHNFRTKGLRSLPQIFPNTNRRAVPLYPVCAQGMPPHCTISLDPPEDEEHLVVLAGNRKPVQPICAISLTKNRALGKDQHCSVPYHEHVRHLAHGLLGCVHWYRCETMLPQGTSVCVQPLCVTIDPTDGNASLCAQSQQHRCECVWSKLVAVHKQSYPLCRSLPGWSDSAALQAAALARSYARAARRLEALTGCQPNRR
mmetsp:Transcript_93630/g.248570  ORF Transcript_93630/g.248570 Transcript_93630/m.248570 type:complete len:216 (+) Transcript_93630:163-810(+)